MAYVTDLSEIAAAAEQAATTCAAEGAALAAAAGLDAEPLVRQAAGPARPTTSRGHPSSWTRASSAPGSRGLYGHQHPDAGNSPTRCCITRACRRSSSAAAHSSTVPRRLIPSSARCSHDHFSGTCHVAPADRRRPRRGAVRRAAGPRRADEAPPARLARRARRAVGGLLLSPSRRRARACRSRRRSSGSVGSRSCSARTSCNSAAESRSPPSPACCRAIATPSSYARSRSRT